MSVYDERVTQPLGPVTGCKSRHVRLAQQWGRCRGDQTYPVIKAARAAINQNEISEKLVWIYKTKVTI